MSCLVRFEQTYFILNISLYNLLSSGAEGSNKDRNTDFQGLNSPYFYGKNEKVFNFSFLITEKDEGGNEDRNTAIKKGSVFLNGSSVYATMKEKKSEVYYE
ncbi:hypothetical protein ACI1SW_03130 [Lactococcus garvieae]